MKRRASFAPALLLGAAAGEILGAVRTREAALHLLDKNRLLANSGHFALPGPSHWDAMANWQTAFTGGLFFALTLGVGGAAVAYAWGRLLSPLPRTVRLLLSIPALAPCAWAALSDDRSLAIGLLILALAGLWSAEGSGADNWKDRFRSAVAILLLLAGFLPLALAGEERFTRLRDRFLLPTETGRVVSDFYYRWTLYPAEAIKPLAALTQPVAALDPSLPAATARAVVSEALALRVLAVPESPSGRGADFRIEDRGGETVAVSEGTAMAWPVGDPEGLRNAFKELSRKSDRAYPLRKATFILLLGGVPLALALVLLGAARTVGAVASAAGERAGRSATGVAVILFAAGLAWAGMPPEKSGLTHSLAQSADEGEVIRAMASEDPVERLYGVIGAARHGKAAQAALLDRLDDPVLNIRYTAAASLGSVFSNLVWQRFLTLNLNSKEWPANKQRLAALLAEEKDWGEVRRRLYVLLLEEKDWYVQERIYASLWSMGWLP